MVINLVQQKSKWNVNVSKQVKETKNENHTRWGAYSAPRPPAVSTRSRRFTPYARLTRFARNKTADSINFPYFDPCGHFLFI